MKTEHPPYTYSSQKLATLLLHIDIAIGWETRIVKTHRSTQLFLYCSEGEQSVKCVCPALEMEASKEEQRGVVRFLVDESAATHQKVKTPWNAVGRNHPFA